MARLRKERVRSLFAAERAVTSDPGSVFACSFIRAGSFLPCIGAWKCLRLELAAAAAAARGKPSRVFVRPRPRLATVVRPPVVAGKTCRRREHIGLRDRDFIRCAPAGGSE